MNARQIFDEVTGECERFTPQHAHATTAPPRLSDIVVWQSWKVLPFELDFRQPVLSVAEG